jgi:hypothetical protein
MIELRKLRAGELLALGGAICVIVALALPWYERIDGTLSAWATFGVGVALIMLAALAALALVLATLAERSPALAVAAAVWCTLLGLVGLTAAIVRVLERPDLASGLCAGPWLALVGTLAIVAGAWQSMRDERTERHEPPVLEPRPPPG